MRFESLDERFHDLPWIDLFEERVQSFFGDGADFLRVFAFAFNADHTYQSVAFHLQRSLLAGGGGREKAGRGLGSMQRQPPWFRGTAGQRLQNLRRQYVGQDTLHGEPIWNARNPARASLPAA